MINYKEFTLGILPSPLLYAPETFKKKPQNGVESWSIRGKHIYTNYIYFLSGKEPLTFNHFRGLLFLGCLLYKHSEKIEYDKTKPQLLPIYKAFEAKGSIRRDPIYKVTFNVEDFCFQNNFTLTKRRESLLNDLLKRLSHVRLTWHNGWDNKKPDWSTKIFTYSKTREGKNEPAKFTLYFAPFFSHCKQLGGDLISCTKYDFQDIRLINAQENDNFLPLYQCLIATVWRKPYHWCRFNLNTIYRHVQPMIKKHYTIDEYDIDIKEFLVFLKRLKFNIQQDKENRFLYYIRRM